jgi:CRP/FNR family transcriptional regulator, nitrogen oxide reductase regulator
MPRLSLDTQPAQAHDFNSSIPQSLDSRLDPGGVLPFGGVPVPNDTAFRASQLFTGVPESVVEAALASGVRCKANRGSCFYRTDEPAHRLFVLTSGLVKLRLVMPSGYRVLFRFLNPGEFFGYQTVLNNSGHYFTTAEAAVDSEAIFWSRAATRRLLRSHPAITVNALSVSLARMQEYQERLAEMACEAVPVRVARQLIRLESGELGENGPVTISGNFTREDLAGLTGSTLHTVSRVLGRWERAGIVEKGPGMVRILAPTKLAQLAGF